MMMYWIEVLVLMISHSSFAILVPGDCKPRWQYYKSKMYRTYIGQSQRSYQRAESSCKRWNANAIVAEPKTEEEIEYLLSFMTRFITEYMWIGGIRNDSGDYVWRSSQRSVSPSIPWSRWHDNEPSSDKSKKCLIIKKHYALRKLKSVECEVHNIAGPRYICSYDVNQTTTTTTKSTSTALQTAEPQGQCEPAWKLYNLKCYTTLYIIRRLHSYPEGDCYVWYKAKLTEPKTVEELDYLSSYVPVRIWIGAKRNDSGDFVWKSSQGSETVSPSIPWSRWLNNGPSSDKSKKCLILDIDKKLKDIRCDNQVYDPPCYVCSKDATIKTESTSPALQTAEPQATIKTESTSPALQTTEPQELFCSPTFQLHGTSCYRYYRTGQQYTAASKACKGMGAKLAEPRDMSKNEEVFQIAKKNSVYGSIWIGTTDSLKEGNFIWASDGQELAWKNWRRGQPNNFNQQDCAEMIVSLWDPYLDVYHSDTIKKWTDINCDLKRPYLCVAEPGRGIDYCANQPCKNGATCHNKHSNYTCTCDLGFAGVNCSIEIEPTTIQTTEAPECPSITLPEETHCPNGFEPQGRGCYFLPKKIPRRLGKKLCSRMDGIRAEPVNWEKNCEMLQFARSKGVDTFWIGLTRRGSDDREWKWEFNGKARWFNWDKDQPVKKGDFALVQSSSGKWKNQKSSNDEKHRVLCQPLFKDDYLEADEASDGMMCRFSVLVTVFSMLFSTANLH